MRVFKRTAELVNIYLTLVFPQSNHFKASGKYVQISHATNIVRHGRKYMCESESFQAARE